MERGSQDDFERAKAASRRFLELDPAGPEAPEAWQMLGRACYQTRDALGEVHAFVERAQLGAVPYADVSNTANLLNRLLYEHELDVEKEEKQNFAHRLLAVMEKRRSEADADAYSRMAWLAIHVGQNAKAVEYASAGLDVEPDNPHCLRIAQRLGVA
jgi:tetratricopeptide (TPR) repeat protein